jgi:peptide methionine sulfoxide reductase MsrA
MTYHDRRILITNVDGRIMKLPYRSLVLFSTLMVKSSGYSPIPDPTSVVQSRRTVLGRWIAATAAAAATATGVVAVVRPGGRGVGSAFAEAGPPLGSAGGGSSLTDVYFGVGCFWHIQHEFVQAERDILGRDDHQLTSRAGYAGGKATDGEGRVCYHNLQFVADYGRLGHGEAVGMSIPEDKIPDFASVYFDLFNPRTKDRVDPMDRGGEYRSIMGLPGGRQHPAYPRIEEIAAQAGFKLVEGKGDDPDTLGKQVVYAYDTAKFPF